MSHEKNAGLLIGLTSLLGLGVGSYFLMSRNERLNNGVKPPKKLDKKLGSGILSCKRPNNNPLNIRDSKANKWVGEVAHNGAFEAFESPIFCYRAGAKLIRNYAKKYGCNTIRKIISRYAPNSENDTENYIKFVAQNMSYSSEIKLNLDNTDVMVSLLAALSRMESGKKPDLSDIRKGVLMV